MNTFIPISELVIDKVPSEFLALESSNYYTLTKTESSRPNIFVSPGDSVSGDLRIVAILTGEDETKEIYSPGIRVQGSTPWNYLRTSPIVSVLDTTARSITFRTEGGVYLLSWETKTELKEREFKEMEAALLRKIA